MTDPYVDKVFMRDPKHVRLLLINANGSINIGYDVVIVFISAR